MIDNSDRFENKYKDIFANLGAVQTMFPQDAKMQMAQLLEEEIGRTRHIQYRASSEQSPAIKGGFVAEEVLAETRNYDAILKGKTSRAFTDLDSQFRNRSQGNRA